MQIDLYPFGVIVAVGLATVIIASIVNRLLQGYFRDVSRKLQVEETTYVFTRRLLVALVYLIGIIGIIALIPQIGSVALALVAGAGFAGIIIGLAAQATLSNIFSGVSLAVSRPFRIGDVLTIRDEYGTVEDITLRHTVIKTWENKRLIIPNGIIDAEAIVNWTINDVPVLWHIEIGIAYDADIDQARAIILDELDTHPAVMHDRPTRVRVLELADFAVVLRAYFWVRDRPVAWDTGCDLRESVKKRFDREGVEIPFPYRTIVYKRDLEQRRAARFGAEKR